MGGFSNLYIELANQHLQMPENEALAELEAKLTSDQLYDQYKKIEQYVSDIFSTRTVDPMLKPYYMVFKPLNERYDPQTVDHKGLTSILTWARKQYGSHTWVISKEKLHCSKIHFNLILFTSSHDYEKRYHEKVFANKYKIYCKPVDDLKNCIHYVLKEALERKFVHYVDWDLKSRSVKKEVPTFKINSHVKRTKTTKFKKIEGPWPKCCYLEGPLDSDSESKIEVPEGGLVDREE